jgi:glycine oxidase
MTAVNSGPPLEEEPRKRELAQSPPSDVLIIGGGVLGLSTACEILSRGLSVTIFEEDPHRSAGWASAGMLSPYAEFSEAGALQDMLRAARAAYPPYVARVEETSGMKVELAFPGTLLPMGAAGSGPAVETLLARFREMGARSRFLDPAQTAAVEPQLGPSCGSILLDDEGYVSPRSLLTALRAAFDHLGGHWVQLSALGLISRQGRVVGAETAAGIVLGGAVLNAAGAWADLFLSPEDLDRYRLRPIRGQIVRLRPARRTEGIRHVIQMAGVGYLAPRADGTVIAGATSEQVGPFPGNTAGGIASILEGARRLVPASENWAFLAAWSGLRPMAANGELFLEADPLRKGLFHGLGLYRHGILLAPVAATRMARLIVEYLGRQGQ